MGGYHSVDTGPLLIEEWLPLQELGIEAQRERAASSALPPLYFLHVWWARRPLVVSRAAVLASLLPAWRPDWPEPLRQRFPTRDAYHAWVRHLLGIQEELQTAWSAIQRARATGQRIENPFTSSRAFTVSPSEDEMQDLLDVLRTAWNDTPVRVLDPMAGGGSIPLEALRLGLTVEANELNPVAAVILAATLDYPARFGDEFANDLARFGRELSVRVREELSAFYIRTRVDEEPLAYLWARTVACPQTGKPIPLSPNWWLQRDDRGRVAVRLLVDPAWPACRFEIVSGPAAERAAEPGTIRGGVAISPWTGEVVDGDYIKREAQAGRMGQQLYAVVVKTPKGIEFRTPTETDLAAAAAAEAELARRLPGWLARGLVPDEEIPEVSNDPRPRRYGMTRWRDLFAPRQLLALGTAVEALRALEPEIQAELPPDRARAVVTYLALAIDKLADYNSRMARWHSRRGVIANTFDRHDFSMKWSHAEMAVVAAGKGLDWAIDQVVDAYRGIARLAQPARLPLWQRAGGSPVERLRVTQGDARRLAHIPDGSVHLVCIDPPYYDNVQYAELSDFFYVWLKRTLGHHYPEWFAIPLVSKEDEAVANPARFAGLGRRAREKLARQDYERKMAAAFRECGRLLRPDGVLTVMFTHKQVDAWDALATALIEAGFQIVASWPVHTESEHSLHQARKNAARSTILLVCRKRPPGAGPVWWDDLRGELSRRVRARAQELAAQGVGGVDLFLAAYGPALSVISARWPVLTSATDPATGKPLVLRPETALDLARREVLALRRERLLHGQRARFDPETDWYLLAWDTFRAVEFPADEARKLALAVGLDLEEDVIGRARLVQRKGDTVALLTPAERRRRGAVDPDAASFARLVDAVHTALLVYDEDGAPACGAFLRRAGLLQHPEFRQCLQALLEAVPRTRGRDGAFLRPEADLLERLRMAFFPELEPPAEPEPEAAVLQLGLLDGEAAEAGEEDEE
jgi:putative DNA methylase